MSKEILSMLARIVILIFALSVHEWAHAYAAYKNGDPTARLAGRMTVNPLAHLDPVGFLMMLFLPVGYAKPVPINPANFNHYKKGMVWTGISGVLSNLVMAVIWIGVWTAMYTFRMDVSNYWLYFVYKLAYYGVAVNLSLMIFNLLPIFPLDGFRIVEACTSYTNRFRQFMYKYGRYILLGLFVESVLVSSVLPSIFGNAGLFKCFDILGWLLENLANIIAWPFQRLWELLWGLFV